jgi:hypothetical protein
MDAILLDALTILLAQALVEIRPPLGQLHPSAPSDL